MKCGTKERVPFTCKSRFCTSCGKKYVDEWVDKTVDEIIDVAHRHIVFTIPVLDIKCQGRDIIFEGRSLIKGMMDCALDNNHCHRAWRIWHPEYGDIYNFSRDAPIVEDEEDTKEDKNKKFMENPKWESQLCLLPV